MDDKKQQDSYFSKLGNLLSNDLAVGFLQFLRGVVQLSAAATFGMEGTVTAAAAFSGLTLFRSKHVERQAKQNLLDLYSQEVSVITSKPVSELKISDLEIAARHRPDGKKNAIALELGAIDKNIKIGLATSVISIIGIASLATVAANLLSTALLTGAGYTIAATAFGGVSKIISMSADHMASSFNGGKAQYLFNAHLKEMAKQSQFRKLEPEQVFSLLLKANPEIEKEIKSKYAKDYNALPIAVKSTIVDSYEDKLSAKHLTGMINRAEMNTQELGFIAYGSSSGNITKTSIQSEPAIMQNYNDSDLSHVAKLNKQRMQEATSRALH